MTYPRPRWKLSRALAPLAVIASIAAPYARVRAQQAEGSAILPIYAEGADPTSLNDLAEDIDAITKVLLGTDYPAPITPTVLRMRLLAYGRFPTEATAAEKQEFEGLSRAALLAVARIRSPAPIDETLVAEARSAIGRAMSFAKDRLESLNHDNALASRVMDTCLLTPRLMLVQGESEQLVVLECLECQRLVPGVTPARNAHPPEVQAAFAKAIQATTTSRVSPSTLDVATTDNCEECVLRLNGRKVGTTPYAGAMVSGNYAVQVEYPGQAAETALVHQITLTAPNTTQVRIDPFERHLRQSGQHIFLVGGAQRDPVSSKRLARRLDVSALILVRAQHGPTVSLEAIHHVNGTRGCYEEGPREEIARLANKLLQCSRTALRESKAIAQASTARQSMPPQSPDSERAFRSRRQRNWGLALMSLGASSLIASEIVLRTPAWQDPDKSASAASERGVHALAIVGGAMTIVSEPMWVRAKDKHPPWWTWVAMAAGTVPVSYGIYTWSIDGDCAGEETPAGCGLSYRTKLRGSTYLAQGLPLLTLPAAHYVARRLRAKTSNTSLSFGIVGGSHRGANGTQQTQFLLQGTF